MTEKIETAIPGRAPIELVSFYSEFRDYYPQCELETKRWCVDNVKPDWWIFDIGANIGYYTILFAELAKNGQVFSFEPTSTADMLRRNLAHNGITNADVVELALGAVKGTHEDRIYRLWGTEGEVKAYSFTTVDDFIAERRIGRLDCMKIDVDSFDFEVLRGAEQTLKTYDPVVIVELNHALAKRNQSAGEALAWLARRGYRKALVLDHDNFILRRDADVATHTAVRAKLELAFPEPLRVVEKLPENGGTELGPTFTTLVHINNGVLVEQQGSQTTVGATGGRSLAGRLFEKLRAKKTPVPLSLKGVAGASIETTGARWSYAATLELAPGTANGTLCLEVTVEVEAGELGVAIAGADVSRFVSGERTLQAMPGTQSVVIKTSASDAKAIVFRNVTSDVGKTRFKIFGLKAKVTA